MCLLKKHFSGPNAWHDLNVEIKIPKRELKDLKTSPAFIPPFGFYLQALDICLTLSLAQKNDANFSLSFSLSHSLFNTHTHSLSYIHTHAFTPTLSISLLRLPFTISLSLSLSKMVSHKPTHAVGLSHSRLGTYSLTIIYNTVCRGRQVQTV